jgi:hypothetical protein
MLKSDYDATVARIAGNVAPTAYLIVKATARVTNRVRETYPPDVARIAVQLARAIVAETIRTEPACPHRYLNTKWCVDCGADRTEPETGEPR